MSDDNLQPTISMVNAILQPFNNTSNANILTFTSMADANVQPSFRLAYANLQRFIRMAETNIQVDYSCFISLLMGRMAKNTYVTMKFAKLIIYSEIICRLIIISKMHSILFLIRTNC